MLSKLLPNLELQTLCNKIDQLLATGRRFTPGTPVSSTNKTDRHDITEILLKAALNLFSSLEPSRKSQGKEKV
jgi:hypothetical protein